MPTGRYDIRDYNTQFVLRNVEKRDEGDYKCEGRSAAGTDSVVMQIDVQCMYTLRLPVFYRASTTNELCSKFSITEVGR